MLTEHLLCADLSLGGMVINTSTVKGEEEWHNWAVVMQRDVTAHVPEKIYILLSPSLSSSCHTTVAL